jgi:hypothetical protein
MDRIDRLLGGLAYIGCACCSAVFFSVFIFVRASDLGLQTWAIDICKSV